MNGLRKKCNNPTIELADNKDSVITYFQWNSVIEKKTVKGEDKTFKITKKVLISSTVEELKMAFIKDIQVMKKHLCGIYSYNKLKKELKESLSEEEVMIQIDFSENYTTKYANEIQSTHFAKNQFSIHTGRICLDGLIIAIIIRIKVKYDYLRICTWLCTAIIRR